MLCQELSDLTDSVIPYDDAMLLVERATHEMGITRQQSHIMDFAVRAIPTVDIGDGVPLVQLYDLYSFINNISNAIQKGDASYLWQKRGLCVKRVADIEEFVESKEFMGQKGSVRPRIMAELIKLFSGNYLEAVLTGAIGIGKNYFVDMGMAYMIYSLSVFQNPQVEYDLAPGSSIIFIMQSLTLTLARKVVFDQFSERLRQSSYFSRHFPFNPDVKSELRFPKGIQVLPVGGTDTAAIGMNVFGGAIDELNFMAKTDDSKYKRDDEDVYDKAEKVYMSLRRRMKSRYIQKGHIPGKLFLVSSVNHPGDFTDRKIEEAKKDKSIFVMKLSLPEAFEGTDRLSPQTFLVEVGNEIKQSRIIESREDAIDVDDVIEVSVDFKSDFERNLDMALREVMGIAVAGSHPFIPHRELIKFAQDEFMASTGGIQLFRTDSCIISNLVDPASPDWETIVNMDYLENIILDPTTVFAGHIDVGVTQDALGIAIGRIIGDKLLPSVKFFNEKTREFQEVKDIRAPFYQLDGLMQVKPPASGEIDLELVRDLLTWLRGHIFLKWVTMDSYQSTMMIQSFRKVRIRSGVLSVDTSLAPYAELKQSIKDSRIWFPSHEVASKELREIEKNKKEKIDHPEGGSKDVSDAMAGVVYILQHKEAVYGRPVSRRRTIETERNAPRRIRIGRGRST